jgi:hypothetical protein
LLRRAGVARVGHLDLRSEAEFTSALRTDRPLRFSWKAVQARVTVGEGHFPTTVEQTLVASGVSITRMLWTN